MLITKQKTDSGQLFGAVHLAAGNVKIACGDSFSICRCAAVNLENPPSDETITVSDNNNIEDERLTENGKYKKHLFNT